jgi:selenide, water dikinase
MDPKEKRKRVMKRSIKLGYCVCDPRKPCPCPMLQQHNVCTCAGERLPRDEHADVALTKFVRSAGCASKISQKDLHTVLRMLPTVTDDRLLVGTATADDAGVFQLSPDSTLVQTVDVFTPGVDDPFLFGRIAACNALSDVYAMGGCPVTALSIIGFPIATLPHEVMAEIIKGGMQVLEEAGVVLLGGHSINDEELKFGFAVTGVVDPAAVVTNAGANPGDVLVLTKPLGTGIVSLASQIGEADAEAVAAMTRHMSSLNRTAAALMVEHGATACTDVTGFGLLGHLSQVAQESAVTIDIWCERLPLLPRVLAYAEREIYSGANERNAEYSADRTEIDGDVSEALRVVLYDPQTSGGLLIALPGDRADALLDALSAAGESVAAIVGRVFEKSQGMIRVHRRPPVDGGRTQVAHVKPPPAMPTAASLAVPPAVPRAAACCDVESAGAPNPLDGFKAFMGQALSPGEVDVVTKALIAVALGLATHCAPCARHHLKRALDMGIGREELEEAAALAIAFSGCGTLMLWKELKEDLLNDESGAGLPNALRQESAVVSAP